MLSGRINNDGRVRQTVYRLSPGAFNLRSIDSVATELMGHLCERTRPFRVGSRFVVVTEKGAGTFVAGPGSIDFFFRWLCFIPSVCRCDSKIFNAAVLTWKLVMVNVDR